MACRGQDEFRVIGGETEFAKHVDPNGGRGCGREAQDRWRVVVKATAVVPEIPSEPEVGGPEVVAPLGDTVRFVDDCEIDETTTGCLDQLVPELLDL